eukprot:bmy_10631T0
MCNRTDGRLRGARLSFVKGLTLEALPAEAWTERWQSACFSQGFSEPPRSQAQWEASPWPPFLSRTGQSGSVATRAGQACRRTSPAAPRFWARPLSCAQSAGAQPCPAGPRSYTGPGGSRGNSIRAGWNPALGADRSEPHQSLRLEGEDLEA